MVLSVHPVCELYAPVWVLFPFCVVLVPVVLGEGEAHLTDRGWFVVTWIVVEVIWVLSSYISSTWLVSGV